MMRRIERTNQFKRDFKREKNSNPRLDDMLVPVIELLLKDEPLPERLRDHALSGPWSGFRDCHIRPDLVLIYAKSSPDTLTLTRLGSHAELFD
jgi:mRNA interferase YafQ